VGASSDSAEILEVSVGISSIEAAEILHCSADNVRRLAREGQLRPIMFTRAGRVFARRDVERLASERQQR
jgi:DNA-binding transcriptional MerR regulator